MGVREAAFDSFLKGMNCLHRMMRTVTGGRVGDHVMDMPVVELHTKGRKTGARRTVLLTSPVYAPDRIVLIASKGGDDRDPDWYRNLIAEPDVEVTVRGVTRPMRARTAGAEERAELWPQITSTYQGYADYQRRTDREIPVVVLEPR